MMGLHGLLLVAGTIAAGGEGLLSQPGWPSVIKDWIAALGPTVLLVVGGILTWFLKARSEELRAIEEKLRDERRRNYQAMLDPFVKFFSSGSNDDLLNKAAEIIISEDYKKVAFEFMFIGSDEVVRAFNRFMQGAFKDEETISNDPKLFVRYWASLLLEIRRDLGRKGTKLKPIETMEGIFLDIHKFM